MRKACHQMRMVSSGRAGVHGFERSCRGRNRRRSIDAVNRPASDRLSDFRRPLHLAIRGSADSKREAA